MTNHRPMFVDTNAFVALYDEDDDRYQRANVVMDGIGAGELAYGPLFTSRYVIQETATVLLYGAGHREAVAALENIHDSATLNVLPVPAQLFERTVEQFTEYADQHIPFVDHLNSVLSEEYGIEHIFAFDEDFRTLGMTRVPVDTGDVDRPR